MTDVPLLGLTVWALVYAVAIISAVPIDRWFERTMWGES